MELSEVVNAGAAAFGVGMGVWKLLDTRIKAIEEENKSQGATLSRMDSLEEKIKTLQADQKEQAERSHKVSSDLVVRASEYSALKQGQDELKASVKEISAKMNERMTVDPEMIRGILRSELQAALQSLPKK